jgi:hypothetical protein
MLNLSEKKNGGEENMKIKNFIFICLLIGLVVGLRVLPVQAATPAQISTAIDKGLKWLAGEQAVDGHIPGLWGDGTADATTGLVVLKFLDRAKELKKDPFQTDNTKTDYYEYATVVTKGFEYIFNNLDILSSNRVTSNDWYPVYSTGIVMMAVATAPDPNKVITNGALNGWTYKQAAQGMMDWFASVQETNGAWLYSGAGNDNSSSGYATLGVGFASSLNGFGLTIPGSIYSNLDSFIDTIRETSGTHKGASVYRFTWRAWPNIYKTGNLLYEMALVGDTLSTQRVKDAIAYIEAKWDSSAAGTHADGGGWKDYQAMFGMMKGLEAFKIEELKIGAGGALEPWFEEVSTYIVNNQVDVGSDKGYWNNEYGTHLGTAWALITLERAVEKVEFGIPGQCRKSGDIFASFDADDSVVFGLAPFTWTWAGNTDLTVTKDANNVFVITYPSGWTGSESIIFTVTDSNGKVSDDEATFTVHPVISVGDIVDQNVAAFVPFDLDNFLLAPVPSDVTWSYSGNSCLVVTIDVDNVVTVTNPGDACTASEDITFTATADSCSESLSDFDVATYTVNRAPVAQCIGVTILSAGADCKASTISIDAGSYDPDGADDIASIVQLPLGPYGLGNTTVTLTITDNSGEFDTCTTVITVIDDTDPTLSCPGPIAVNNTPGTCGAVVNYDVTGADNCPGATTVQTSGLGSGSTFPVGTTTETYTVTDAAGNTASCSITVTVTDAEAPSISCPADITVNNDAGECGAVVDYIVTDGSDNCPGANTAQTAGLTSGSTFPVGTTVNTFMVTDAAGNTASCSFSVTVVDAENPAITCPADIAVDNDAGVCGATVTYATPVGTDNCPGATTSQTAGLGSGSTFPVGTTTNTFVVTDATGNTASCSFTVTVTDAEDPEITCPDDVTLDCPTSDEDTDIAATGSATATDNCGATVSHSDSTEVPCGNTRVITRTWTATDDAGNTDTCVQTITVQDITAPEVTATLVPVKLKKKHGCFRVEFSATDACDAELDLTAELNGHPVTDGELVRLHHKKHKKKGCRVKVDGESHDSHSHDGDSGSKSHDDDSSSADCGTVKFECDTFVLTVTATDDCGNADTATAEHIFPSKHDGHSHGSSDDDSSSGHKKKKGKKKKK